MKVNNPILEKRLEFMINKKQRLLAMKKCDRGNELKETDAIIIRLKQWIGDESTMIEKPWKPRKQNPNSGSEIRHRHELDKARRKAAAETNEKYQVQIPKSIQHERLLKEIEQFSSKNFPAVDFTPEAQKRVWDNINKALNEDEKVNLKNEVLTDIPFGNSDHAADALQYSLKEFVEKYPQPSNFHRDQIDKLTKAENQRMNNAMEQLKTQHFVDIGEEIKPKQPNSVFNPEPSRDICLKDRMMDVKSVFRKMNGHD